MPMIDVAMPTMSATMCQRGSPAVGHAIEPRKKTLTIETR
jgi:hypothetical protein